MSFPRGEFSCVILFVVNIGLVLNLLLVGLDQGWVFRGIMLTLVGLALIGLIGVITQRPFLVWIYFLFSFLPLGFYFLGTPSVHAFIGATNLVVLAIYLLRVKIVDKG